MQDIDCNELKTKNTSYNLGYECIREMRVPFFSRFPHKTLPKDAFNNDVLLMRACKNLTFVTTSWVGKEVTYFCNRDRYIAQPIEQIVKEYRLDGMLDLRKLKFLHLDSEDTDRVYEISGDV